MIDPPYGTSGEPWDTPFTVKEWMDLFKFISVAELTDDAQVLYSYNNFIYFLFCILLPFSKS